MNKKENSMKLNTTFEKISRQFRIEFGEMVRETNHRLSSGEAREVALIQLLKKYLPKRVSVDRGFVIDALGNESKQIDVIIYDAQYGTVFDVSGVKYFPCETVIAVGEVKSDVKSNRTLRDALGKIKSVKDLDRSNRNTNEIITGPGISLNNIVEFSPSLNHRDQIFGFIFTQTTMSEPSLLLELANYMRNSDRTKWLNMFCAFDQVLVTYKNEKEKIEPSAMDSKSIIFTKESEIENLLLMFICILSNFVGVSHVCRPIYFDYASMISTMNESWDIEELMKPIDD